MPEESETVTGNPAQEQNNEDQKDNANHTTNQHEADMQVNSENDSQPSVEACILKAHLSNEGQSQTEPLNNDNEDRVCPLNKDLGAKSPVVIATETFLLNEKIPTEPVDELDPKLVPSEVVIEQVSEESNLSLPKSQVPESELVSHSTDVIEPRTPANSEASEGGGPSSGEEIQDSLPAQVEDVHYETEPVVITLKESPTILNGDLAKELSEENLPQRNDKASTECQLTNGQRNGECNFDSKKVPESILETHSEKNQVLIESIANELKTEDYKLPDVDKVKKQFECAQQVLNDVTVAPPKKGALSTRLDSQNVRKAYEDVRYDGSETQWAVFKFEGPIIVTSAIGSDFSQFKAHFREDERAFGYIRVQTGDELSKRAKFLLVTWVGPSVSVLKRAKMSTDKALIKDILTNFAVELQTENILDIDLQNFENELDKAAGAHYGTGVRC